MNIDHIASLSSERVRYPYLGDCDAASADGADAVPNPAQGRSFGASRRLEPTVAA